MKALRLSQHRAPRLYVRSSPKMLGILRYSRPFHASHKRPPFPFTPYTPASPKPPRFTNSKKAAILLTLIGVGSIVYIRRRKPPSEGPSHAVQQPANETEAESEVPAQSSELVSRGISTIYPALSLEEANAKLRNEEQSRSYPQENGSGVSRVDSVRLGSNEPVEDEFAHNIIGMGQPIDWHFWGIYDGHAGWATAKLLRRSLIASVATEIKKDLDEGMTDRHIGINAAIQSAFVQLDNKIMNVALKALRERDTALALAHIAPARSGSCALLAVYDPNRSDLRVASVGNSRAVMGRRSTGDDWSTMLLSRDHTGFNEMELDRVLQEHPEARDAIDHYSRRIFGLAVTRAFGDNRWKWPEEAIERWYERFLGLLPLPNYHSPPYLTAEPDTTAISVQKGDFLILASDGFWDRMTNDDAVQCVRHWMLKTRSEQTQPPEQGEKEPGITPFYRYHSRDYTLQDDNAATHLARNALGGNNLDVFKSLLSMQAPEASGVRDDITIQVIFFGDRPVTETTE